MGTRPIFLERGTVDAYEQRSKILEDESFSWFRLKSRERRDARWVLLEGDASQLIVATDGRALHLSSVVADVPYNYFIVIASPEEIRALRRLEGVIWVGTLSAPQRTSRLWDDILAGIESTTNVTRFLISTGIQTDTKGRVLLEVITPPLLSHPASTLFAKSVFVRIAQQFGDLDSQDDSKCFIYVHAAVLHSVIGWLSAHRAVHWVAPVLRFSYHNRIANEKLQAGAEETKTPVWDIGITGSQQIVGVGDTGADAFSRIP